MDYFAGLDVSVKETSVCIVDNAGKIVREARVASEPEALLQVLTNTIYRLKRVGLEAGPLSQWLYSVLAEAGLPVICVETRHMRAVLKAQINQRLRQGETQADIARTYNVDPATISRLAAASPFEYGAVAVAQ
jgi:transposase